MECCGILRYVTLVRKPSPLYSVDELKSEVVELPLKDRREVIMGPRAANTPAISQL